MSCEPRPGRGRSEFRRVPLAAPFGRVLRRTSRGRSEVRYVPARHVVGARSANGARRALPACERREPTASRAWVRRAKAPASRVGSRGREDRVGETDAG